MVLRQQKHEEEEEEEDADEEGFYENDLGAAARIYIPPGFSASPGAYVKASKLPYPFQHWHCSAEWRPLGRFKC